MKRIKVGNDIVMVSGSNVRIKTGPVVTELELSLRKQFAVSDLVDLDGNFGSVAFHSSVIDDCIRSER